VCGRWRLKNIFTRKIFTNPCWGVKSDTITMKQWKLKDREVLGLIRLTLSKNVAFNIIKEKTISELKCDLDASYVVEVVFGAYYLIKLYLGFLFSFNTHK